MEDMKKKGRANRPHGKKNGMAKLTEEDVRYIRANWKFRSKEFSQKALAKKFNVNCITIQDIIHNRSWIDTK